MNICGMSEEGGWGYFQCPLWMEYGSFLEQPITSLGDVVVTNLVFQVGRSGLKPLLDL